MDTNGKLMIFAIVLNVFAGIGAFLFGFIDDYIGGKKTIQLTNAGFVIALVIALAPIIKNGELYFGCLEFLLVYLWGQIRQLVDLWRED